MNLLKIEDIFNLKNLKFYFKFKHNDLPKYLQSLPILNNYEIHSHATRSKNNIHITQTSHKFTNHCIRNFLPTIINNTSTNVLHKIITHSLQGFTNYYKHSIYVHIIQIVSYLIVIYVTLNCYDLFICIS